MLGTKVTLRLPRLVEDHVCKHRGVVGRGKARDAVVDAVLPGSQAAYGAPRGDEIR